MNYKRKMVSPYNLFGMLFISRVLVVFMGCTSRHKGDYSPDLIISIAVAFAFFIISSIPVVYAAASKTNIIERKPISYFYGIYYTYLGAINVGQFVTLAITDLNRNTNALFLAALIIIACVYAASLGIEAVSRFASFVFVLTILGIVLVLATSVKEASLINLFPFSKNGTKDIFMNSICYLSDSSELVLLLFLAPHINGKVKKPFYYAVISAFVVGMVLILDAISVLGDAASLSSFPFFELSQILKFSKTERWDSIFTAFWIFAAFLKTSLFVYGASVTMKPLKQRSACALSGVLMFAFVWLIIISDYFLKSERTVSVILFVLFGVIVPIITILFRKKSKGDKVLESF